MALGLGLALSAPPSAWAASETTLESVEVTSGDTLEVRLRLAGASGEAAVSTFDMEDKTVLVIDIADCRPSDDLAAITGDGGLLDRGEVVSFDDQQGTIGRVTLYFTASVSHSFRVEGGEVVVRVTPLAATEPVAEAPAADPMADALASASTGTIDDAPRQLSGPDQLGGNVSVASLDFQNLDAISRVVIGVAGTTQFTTSQPQTRLIVVDIPGAFLPRSLRRVLDTSDFLSPVRSVRAYRTSSGARVAISLRSDAQYSAVIDDQGLIAVDVVIPERMLTERATAEQEYSTVSPSGSDEGLSNAYQEELMISESGHTSDPQAVFGQGAGSNDPSSLLGMASGFMVDNSSASSLPYAGRKISLDFVNADIHSIFRLISHVSRLNIVSGDDVKGEVTVRMVDVPWDQALAAILTAKGLGSQRFGNIVRIAPIETIKSEQQSALEAKRAQEELTELQLLVLPLNYVQASQMQSQIETLLSSRGSVQVDQTSNQLIIQESEDKLAQIRELVRHLDKETPQVLIEARVVEANSNYSQALGIEWGGELDATASTGYGTGLFFPDGVGVSGGQTTGGGALFPYTAGSDNMIVDMGAEASTSSLVLNLGSIPGLIDLDARLSAMETDGWGKVISSPRVTTLDNKSASISQGQKIPYLSTSSGGTSVQFVQASLQLNVTPHITSDNKVFLKVMVNNDRADFSQLVQGQPAIQIKEVETELLVADGDTTVLGGVFSTEQSFSQDRTPGLSKIPLLGYLFKNSAEALTRNELLVFITPHIVTKPADA